MITIEQIKKLRDSSGVSVMQCKKALEESSGDIEKALLVLRKKSSDIAAKKSDRLLKAGVIESYIHSNKIVGVIIELSCETDFVARNEDFRILARDLAMHVTAANPEYIDLSDISSDVLKKVTEMFKKEVEESGKLIDIQQKIIEGKISAYFDERTLLKQSFIKNPDITIEELVNNNVQKFGEKIKISRFVRFMVGN